MIIGIDASRAVTRKRTGTEAYAYFLINALIPIALEKGHQIRLYFNQPPPSDPFFDALPDHRVEQLVLSFPRLWTHARLGFELFRRRPSIFFTPAHVIPYTFKGPAVATVHDLGYHHFPKAHTKSQLSYLTWSTRHNCRRSQIVVTDSIATQNDIETFYGLPSNKIKVIYPSFDPHLSRVKDENSRRAVLDKFKINDPFLLYLGTLQPRKNLERLVDAYLASGVSHQLILAGQAGWLSESILDKIKRLPSAQKNKIILTGYVSDDEKAALLSAATALLFPSLYEGFGFPVLEAQVCETAVLCSNSSSLPEVAGNAAHFVDPLNTQAIAQGIQTICADDEYRQTLINKGIVNTNGFSWDTTAFQLLTLFESIHTP
ncbi:MAG: glycosyltransferase family 1 protein [Chloroflexota bacterium]